MARVCTAGVDGFAQPGAEGVQLLVGQLGLVQGLDLPAQIPEGSCGGPGAVVALDETGFFLDFLQGFLRPDDGVPDALTGDVVIFRDLRQG